MLVISKPIIILYKKTALFLRQYHEVYKRSSPKERTDSSELTKAMPVRNRKYFCVFAHFGGRFSSIFFKKGKKKILPALYRCGNQSKKRWSELLVIIHVQNRDRSKSLVTSKSEQHCRAPICPHPAWAPDQDIFMHPHFFRSVESKVQVGTEDVGSGFFAARSHSRGSAGWRCLSAASPCSSPANNTSLQLPCLIWRDTWLTFCFTWGMSLPACHTDMKI